MGKKKRKGSLAAVILFAAALLAGCGDKVPAIGEVENSSVYLTKEGIVTAFLVEEFDKEYYSESELEEMIRLEIEDYCSQAKAGDGESAPVRLIQILSPDEKAGLVGQPSTSVTVQMEYASPEEYSGFNGKVLYVGTVNQAQMAGYPIKADLRSVSDDSVLTRAQAQEMEEQYLLVTQENVPVHVPYDILYVSDGVTVEENTVSFEGTGGGFAYVIMKK